MIGLTAFLHLFEEDTEQAKRQRRRVGYSSLDMRIIACKRAFKAMIITFVITYPVCLLLVRAMEALPG